MVNGKVDYYLPPILKETDLARNTDTLNAGLNSPKDPVHGRLSG